MGKKHKFNRQIFRQQSFPKKLPHIYVIIFTGSERTHWIHPLTVLTLMRWALTQQHRAIFSFSIAHAIHPVAAARNKAVEDVFLKSNADAVLLLDNDVVPPDGLLDGILTMPRDASILICPYIVWDPKQLLPMLCFGHWDGERMVPFNGTLALDEWQYGEVGGTGAMVIKREVFTEGKLSPPFFKIEYDQYDHQKMTEDIYFTSNAHKAGYKIVTNASYACSHHHTLDLLDMSQGFNLHTMKIFEAIRKKYGDIGINIGDLTRELMS